MAQMACCGHIDAVGCTNDDNFIGHGGEIAVWTVGILLGATAPT